MALAPTLNETISRTDAERARAISNLGYQAARNGRYSTADNPYTDGDGESWNEGFLDYLDRDTSGDD